MTMRPEERQLTTADIARGGATTTKSGELTEESSESTSASTWAGDEHTERRQQEKPTESAADSRASNDASAPLFAPEDGERFHTRWTDVQAGFVDDPRQAVEHADGLVAEVIKNLAEAFATERSGLEQQWQQGEDVSTEDLRLALRRYRSFFDRLLSV